MTFIKKTRCVFFVIVIISFLLSGCAIIHLDGYNSIPDSLDFTLKSSDSSRIELLPTKHEYGIHPFLYADIDKSPFILLMQLPNADAHGKLYDNIQLVGIRFNIDNYYWSDEITSSTAPSTSKMKWEVCDLKIKGRPQYIVISNQPLFFSCFQTKNHSTPLHYGQNEIYVPRGRSLKYIKLKYITDVGSTNQAMVSEIVPLQRNNITFPWIGPLWFNQ